MSAVAYGLVILDEHTKDYEWVEIMWPPLFDEEDGHIVSHKCRLWNGCVLQVPIVAIDDSVEILP